MEKSKGNWSRERNDEMRALGDGDKVTQIKGDGEKG